MKIKAIASNMTELCLNNGKTILFSYKTAVACFLPGIGYLQTEEYYSVTTTKHINKWVGVTGATEISQDYIDALVK